MLVDAGDARNFIHSRASQAFLREHLSRGNHDAPDRRELAPFPEDAAPDR